MSSRMKLELSAALAGVCLSVAAERIELKTDYASCVVETEGARILSFRPADGEEVVWNADPIQTSAPKWAHGGIPVCWPWFGVNGKVDIHGTAWKSPFAVVSNVRENGRARLVLARDEEKARIELTVSLYDALKLELKTTNTSGEPFRFSAAFHPYFRVGDVARCSVGGVNEPFEASALAAPISLANPIDDVFPANRGSCSVYRLSDPVLDRTLYVFAENSTHVNVWNPGAPKDTPGFIPGDSWKGFACVEPVLGSVEEPVALKPGDYVSLMMGVEVRKGSKTSGYLGADPRRPQAAEKLGPRPFHVLYLGAHPDDGDYDYGAAIAQLVRSGAKVSVVTFCNGNKGHVEMEPAALAARRLKEAQSAAKVYGLERYVVNECPDCELDASRAWRERMGRLVRNLAPDMVLTHRPVDYHADHRAVGQVSQDLAYFLGVPHWCGDTPVPEKLPFFLYTVDAFTVPRRLRPDLVVNCEPMLEVAARGVSCHASQLFEWMPPQDGIDPKTLSTPEIRRDYIRKYVRSYYLDFTGRYPDLVERLFGRRDVPVTVAELSEYSREPAKCEVDYLESVPGFKWTRK